jgi:hypothetical protein
MKKLFTLIIATLVFSVPAFSQDMKKHEMKDDGKPKATEKDKTEAIPVKGSLKRGAPLGKSDKVSLVALIAAPDDFKDRKVRVDGVIVRSCKMEGCWLELAPMEGAKSIRVTMKGHAFFVPLSAAGSMAKTEGSVQVKTLSAEHVKHMIEEDGAKFDNINADGTVTEISFEATGVELTRKK